MAGFIQLTGKHNYQQLANYLNDHKVMTGVDYVANLFPFTSAGFWWLNNDMSNYINDEGADIYKVSTAVNGGNPFNGGVGTVGAFTGIVIAPTGANEAHSHTFSSSTAGTNNLPPYYALAFIMKG